MLPSHLLASFAVSHLYGRVAVAPVRVNEIGRNWAVVVGLELITLPFS